MTDELRLHWTLHLLDEDSARHDAVLAKHPETKRLHEGRIAAARKALTVNETQQAEAAHRRRALELEIAAADTEQQRFERQLTQVTDQKQFEAVHHEIANVRAKRSDVETAALELLDREETLEAARPALAQTLERAEADAAAALATLASEAAAHGDALAALEQQRQSALAALDANARSRYERMRPRTQNRPVAALVNGACGACFRAQPPAAVQEAKRREKLLVCDGCGRLVMLAPEDGASA